MSLATAVINDARAQLGIGLHPLQEVAEEVVRDRGGAAVAASEYGLAAGDRRLQQIRRTVCCVLVDALPGIRERLAIASKIVAGLRINLLGKRHRYASKVSDR